MGATEDGSPIPVVLELVKRFGGQVVASVSLMDAESFTNWSVDAPFYLRISIADGAAPAEMLIGVRIMPEPQGEVATDGAATASDPTKVLPIPEDENAPVPKLVVPAN